MTARTTLLFHPQRRLPALCGVALCAAMLVSGCSRTEGFPRPQLVAEPDPVVARLAAAADRAANALDTLASIENTRTPVEIPPLVAAAPVELRRAITVDWVGPVEPLARQLADRASYQFITSGQAPVTEAIVTLRVRNEPLIEVFRNLGLQLNNRATLKVDPDNRVVEIVYGPITPPSVDMLKLPMDTTAPSMSDITAMMTSPAPAMPVPVVNVQNLDSGLQESTANADNPLAKPF